MDSRYTQAHQVVRLIFWCIYLQVKHVTKSDKKNKMDAF